MSKSLNKLKSKHRDHPNRSETKKNSNKKKQADSVYIGQTNVKLWQELKSTCKFKKDEEFGSFLLNLAQEHIRKQNVEVEIEKPPIEEPPKINVPTEIPKIETRKEGRKRHKSEKSHSKHKKGCDKKEKNKNKKKSNNIKPVDFESPNVNTEKPSPKIDLAYPLPMVVVEKMDFSNPNLNKTSDILNNVVNEETKQNLDIINEDVINDSAKIDDVDMNPVSVEIKNKKLKTENIDAGDIKKYKPEKIKRKIKHHDTRKAPDILDIKPIIKTENVPQQIETFPTITLEQQNENVQERVAIKIKLCNNCNTRHLQEVCPLRNSICEVNDTILLENYINDNEKVMDELQTSMDEDDSDSVQKEILSYAFKSLPEMLYLEDTNCDHGLSVFTKCDVKEYTQFGPLIGKMMKEVDIPEDFGMKHLWEIYAEKNIYVNTENANTSNWLRYLRPAPSRELRNITAVSKSNQLYMVTTRNITSGEELLYWQDDALGTNKKKMEKTNCGGCNLSFAHPLYYRMHCAVFHDIRYSLTIRKYHCKVCGLAVLGKDNIMKHAVEQHNGQGAYQCQFCKKFFLRLNYLEMHRTYGCSANPHRSRPLCDFCGRKFCQPQKLKVHIKRMHSDMTEVLREFQCKNCMKLLGSRAALQRHVKEVHQKQVEGACTCIRCGKLFQNKSNLKIHMLTHSGVKPFKCKEDNCNAAFTTKQCLQFHYKKVHGFAEDIMPKIERSVEYTFAAYAGMKDTETDMILKNSKTNKEMKSNENLMCLDESTDVDDISLDDKNLDDPPALHSPIPITSEHSSGSEQTPPILEAFSRSGKVLSKGSKKWLGEEITPTLTMSMTQQQKDVYSFEKEVQKPDDGTTSASNIMLEVEETQTNFDRNKLNLNINIYNRHESSNASLLVEAALDSVSDIQITNTEPNIDVSGSQSCTDSLVNNLYSLSHQDNLPDVVSSYNQNEDLHESRDINLISPSVNDHISVTDHDLNDEITPNRTLSLDYMQHNDFSPNSSPNLQSRSQLMHDYSLHGNSPSNTPRSRFLDSDIISPGNSPPRYDFSRDNLSSDESNNGIVAQNLSLNGSKDKLRLDLYKTHYSDLKYEGFRPKYDNKIYDIGLDERGTNECNLESSEMRNKSYDAIEQAEIKMKQFDIEADFRNSMLRTKYDEEIHNKQMSLDVDLRTDDRIDSDFRTDRNFTEPLILNSTELQGLDMSARGYHNFHPTGTVQTSLPSRYHHLYPELERPSVDLRLGYSPPPPPYTHADVLRVVSLDLTPPGRHSVDLSLRSHTLHPHQLSNSRLLPEHPLPTNRLLSTDHRLTLDHNLSANRLISDHTTNRLLSNDQTRVLDDSRLLDQRGLLTETRILQPTPSNTPSIDLVTARGGLSPGYGGYSVSPSPYASTLTGRGHSGSPGHTSATGYHHYSGYY